MRINAGMRLLDTTLRELDAAAERMGRSRASVVEILIGLHAKQLTAETMIPASLIPANSRAKRNVKQKLKR